MEMGIQVKTVKEVLNDIKNLVDDYESKINDVLSTCKTRLKYDTTTKTCTTEYFYNSQWVDREYIENSVMPKVVMDSACSFINISKES